MCTLAYQWDIVKTKPTYIYLFIVITWSGVTREFQRVDVS